MIAFDCLLLLVLGAAAAGPSPSTGRALRLPAGERVGTLQAEGVPRRWRAVEGEGSPSRFDTMLSAAGQSGRLIVDVAETVPGVPPPTARSIVVSELELESAEGEPFVELYCPEVEVLAPRRGDGRRLVRAFVGGDVVFEGFTTESLRHVEWGNCGSRVVRQDSVVPRHYLRAQPDASARARLEGAIYWNQGSGCQRWEFHRAEAGLELRRRRVVKYPGDGLREEITAFPFEEERGQRGELHMYDSAVTTRWLRQPRPVEGFSEPGVRAPTGAIFRLGFVRVTKAALTWILGASEGVVAYHPADAQTWFRSREACEAASGK